MDRLFCGCLLLLCAAAARPASALSVNVDGGVELLGYRGFQPGLSRGLTAGIVVEERWSKDALDLWLFEDAQFPNTLAVANRLAPSYFPIDLGLRAGVQQKRVRPYVGLYGSMLVLLNPGPTPFLERVLWMVGADAGLDVLISRHLSVGVEARYQAGLNATINELGAEKPYLLQYGLVVRSAY